MNHDNDIPLHYLSRRTDPITSDLAIAKLEATGRLNTQRVAVYRALSAHPGSTSAEIAVYLESQDRYIPSRRLPDLEKLGLVGRGPHRMCRACGNTSQTWFCIDLRKKEKAQGDLF